MPKNDKEIKKLYNKKINMMFVAKDLTNFDDASKSRILFTIVQCEPNSARKNEVDFFLSIVDFKTLYNLIMFNKIREEWKSYKGSHGEARILTVAPVADERDRYIRFKIDSGKGLEQENGAWKMVRQERSLIYNMGLYDTIELLTAVNETIENSRLQHMINKVTALNGKGSTHESLL